MEYKKQSKGYILKITQYFLPLPLLCFLLTFPALTIKEKKKEHLKLSFTNLLQIIDCRPVIDSKSEISIVILMKTSLIKM